MLTIISNPFIPWQVAVECNNVLFHDRLAVLFELFCVTRENNYNAVKGRLLKITEHNGIFKVDNTFVCTDINQALGMTLEIILSPYYLQSETYIFLHGAVLERDKKAILIIAPTQQGKSSISAMLAINGYHYLSDDIIPVNIKNLTVVTFPKVLCIRNMSLLEKYVSDLNQYFKVLNFKILNEDNTSHQVESRYPLIPRNSISVKSDNKGYDIHEIILLKRTNKIAHHEYAVKELDKAMSYRSLLFNLRAPNQITLFKEIGGSLIRKVRTIEIEYSEGFEYLQELGIKYD